MADDSHVISYLTLRKSLGISGLLMPVILVAGTGLLSDEQAVQPAISDYYYTVMRDVFVSFLAAFGLFLVSYTGYEKKDMWTTFAAGIFAIAVDFFPTNEGEGCGNPSCIIHFVSAGLFFLTLAYISYFLSDCS